MFSLIESIEYLLRNKKITLGIPVLCGCLGFVLAWVLPPIYRSEIRLRVDESSESSLGSLSSLVGSGESALGGLESYIGNASSFEPEDLYIEVLTGRDVSLKTIQKFRLDTLYKKKSNDLLLKRFSSELDVSVENTGVISLAFEGKSKEMIRDLLRYTVTQANDIYMDLQRNRLRQNISYLKQIQSSIQDSIEENRVELTKFLKANDVIDLKSQMQLTISALASYEEQIRNLKRSEANLGNEALGTEELKRKRYLLENEYKGLRKEKPGTSGADGRSIYVNTDWAASKLVEQEQLEARMKRLLKLHELLATEIATTEAKAMKAMPVIQILQDAYLPDWKTRPKRAIWAGGFFAVSLLTIALAVLLHGIRNGAVSSNPEVRNGLERLIKSIIK